MLTKVYNLVLKQSSNFSRHLHVIELSILPIIVY